MVVLAQNFSVVVDQEKTRNSVGKEEREDQNYSEGECRGISEEGGFEFIEDSRENNKGNNDGEAEVRTGATLSPV